MIEKVLYRYVSNIFWDRGVLGVRSFYGDVRYLGWVFEGVFLRKNW